MARNRINVTFAWKRLRNSVIWLDTCACTPAFSHLSAIAEKHSNSPVLYPLTSEKKNTSRILYVHYYTNTNSRSYSLVNQSKLHPLMQCKLTSLLTIATGSKTIYAVA